MEHGAVEMTHGNFNRQSYPNDSIQPVDQNHVRSTRNSTELNTQDAIAQSEPLATAVPIPRSLTLRLYISHFLSTWSSRLFEFGAVLFLASVYPGTLLPMSVYALVRSGSAIIFSPAVGAWIDRANRLSVVRMSIVGQRLSVVASCGIFWVLERIPGIQRRLRTALFVLVVMLACVEKLCAVMNTVSIERDWIVVITLDNEPTRQKLNARMRRIDLFCKLVGPLAISLINGASVIAAIWTASTMSMLSVVVEYICIAKVYDMAPALHRSQEITSPEAAERQYFGILSWIQSRFAEAVPWRFLSFYFWHRAFLPSICLALLYFTVLSFSGQMITFLLSTGYNSIHVGVTRTVSTIFELSATWIAPRLSKKIGPIRGGIWFLSWQMAWLAGGVTFFFANGPGDGNKRIAAATGLVAGVALSRVGLWGFDLCAQNIIQDTVDGDHRGAFSSVEASFQNLFELLSYASTIIFSRPDQFRWPILLSVAAVYLAGGLYTAYVRRRRGHLFHAPDCIHPKIDS